MAEEAGAGARARAGQNRLEAQRQRPTTPTATECCRGGVRLILGVFFDGTDNSMNRDRPNDGETNVVRLYDVYNQGTSPGERRYKVYIEGIGVNRGVRDYNGIIRGAGGRDRLIAAYRWVREKCDLVSEHSEKVIDVYGFSRGAALARTFVNLVNMGLKQQVPNVRVRFLGIFDTVGSFGVPGDFSEPGQNLFITGTDAASIYHLTAKDEIRYNFPLTTTPYDHGYVGVHSDVGGSYEPGFQGRTNHLAYVAFMDMNILSRQCGVLMRGWRTVTPGAVDPVALKVQARRFDQSRSGRGPMSQEEYRRFYFTYVHQSHDQGFGHEAESSGRRRRSVGQPRKRLTAMPPNFQWDE